MIVLCLNSGSSSLKFAYYEIDDAGDERCVLSGAHEHLNSVRDTPAAVADAFHAGARAQMIADAVGHRVVFGGDRHAAPEHVTPAVLADLRTLVPFAPEHMPAGLSAIDAALAVAPAIPHVACYDTAFHQPMPELARRLPLPDRYWQAGIRRYGFHGLSYEYILSVLGADARGRLIVAHLGHGASMAAIRDGHPVDTTMGLTPIGGLMMSTRTGDLDPGVMLHLAREHGLDIAALQQLVMRESGLVAVSEISGDMEALLGRRDDRKVALAIDMFCYSARKYIGALTAVLGGVDTLVFTGGIGEHAAPVRQRICDGLGHLQIVIDAEANAAHAPIISVPGAACTVRVVRTNENLVIARHVHRVVQSLS